MDITAIAVALFAYLFAGLIKGTTGLGFSTSCLPVLVLAFGLKDALALIILPSLISNVTIMRDAGHFRETVSQFWPLYVALLPGIVLGLVLLDRIDGVTAAGVLGAVLCVYALHGLAGGQGRLPQRWERPLAAPTGFLTGLINGITGSQVIPLLPYMLALPLEPNRFVQAVNCSFTLSSVVMAAGLSTLNLFSMHQLALSLAGIVPALGGVKVGSILRRRLDPMMFRKLVLLVLLALGISMIWRLV